MPLIRHPAIDRLLGWVPGSDIVLFASFRSGTQDAWALRVADGKPEGEPVLIRKEIGPISPLGFTREGSFYYYPSGKHQWMFMRLRWISAKGLVMEPPKKIIRPAEGMNSNAEWSPDGKYLAYVSERPGQDPETESSYYVVCIRSEETGEVREAHASHSLPLFYNALVGRRQSSFCRDGRLDDPGPVQNRQPNRQTCSCCSTCDLYFTNLFKA